MYRSQKNRIVFCTFSLLALSSCNGQTFSGGTNVVGGVAPSPIERGPSGVKQDPKLLPDSSPSPLPSPDAPAYCGIFSGDTGAVGQNGVTATNGLQGTLRYLDPTSPLYSGGTVFSKLNGYWNPGVDISIFNTSVDVTHASWNVLGVKRDSQATAEVLSVISRNNGGVDSTASVVAGTVHSPAGLMYFGQLNIPEQDFSKGFSDQSGSAIQVDGTTITEWFNIEFQSQFRLGATDPEGYYQFGTESDDGVVLQMQDPVTGWKTLINNPTPHPLTTNCSASVYLVHDKSYPLDVNYFQGPRVSMALVLRARFLGPIGNAKPVGCSPSAFFYNNVGLPKSSTVLGTGLAGDGYYVVPSQNFFLPGNATNPCLK